MKLRTIASAALAALLGAGAALAEEEKQVNLFFWPSYIPDELLERFTKETGIAITMDIYDTNEALLAKLQAGAAGYDVVIPSGYIVPTMIQAGLLQKFDAPSLPNGGNIAPGFADPEFDPGRQYTAPYMWGTTGLVYDSAGTDVELPESWSVFFEPGPLSGKVAALDDEVEVFNAAAYYLGIDKCTEDPREGQQILDLLSAQKPHLLLYGSSGTIDRVLAGEVTMHHIWNGAAHRVRKARDTARYIYPKEGITQWADNLAIPTGAEHPENAKIFIDFLMKPENVAEITNFTGYMNAISGSEPYLTPEIAADPAVNMPAEYADRLRPGRECSPAARDLRNRIWTRLKK
ncbi:extracellular solute-binding protein [Rhodobacteraceae bacterium F11138]|nr:extracellular solute-binding protein [Rhodobacteraceae bacterium F11138]